MIDALGPGRHESDRTGRFDSRRTTVRPTSCEQPTCRPNYDTMQLDHRAPRLRSLAEDLRQRLSARTFRAGDAEDWDSWWAATEHERPLAGPLAERRLCFADRQRHPAITVTEFQAAMLDAGFREAATLRQIANRHLLVGLR